MCSECKKECIGTTPCSKCIVSVKAKENNIFGDILAVISIIVVAYLWAIILMIWERVILLLCSGIVRMLSFGLKSAKL